MKNNAFSKYHPAVNLIFFAAAICFSSFITHPVYLFASLTAGIIYYFIILGAGGFRLLTGAVPLFVFIALLNPLLNTRGNTVLFSVFGRPYTVEALLYGTAVAAVFVSVLVWLSCFGAVLTSDKLMSLTGGLLPALSMLTVTVLRMLPSLLRKAREISSARMTLGIGARGGSFSEKISEGLSVLGALATQALEGSVVTADSMRSRGWGTGRRTSFRLYSFTLSDTVLLAVMTVLCATVAVFAAAGKMKAQFVPSAEFESVLGINSVGLAAYFIFLLIPSILQLKECLRWNSLKLRS